jgi:hypothetical protein
VRSSHGLQKERPGARLRCTIRISKSASFEFTPEAAQQTGHRVPVNPKPISGARQIEVFSHQHIKHVTVRSIEERSHSFHRNAIVWRDIRLTHRCGFNVDTGLRRDRAIERSQARGLKHPVTDPIARPPPECFYQEGSPISNRLPAVEQFREMEGER